MQYVIHTINAFFLSYRNKNILLRKVDVRGCTTPFYRKYLSSAVYHVMEYDNLLSYIN